MGNARTSYCTIHNDSGTIFGALEQQTSQCYTIEGLELYIDTLCRHDCYLIKASVGLQSTAKETK